MLYIVGLNLNNNNMNKIRDIKLDFIDLLIKAQMKGFKQVEIAKAIWTTQAQISSYLNWRNEVSLIKAFDYIEKLKILINNK